MADNADADCKQAPGRRIVQAELHGNGRALPWVDLAAFARRAITLTREDRGVVRPNGPIFYDRGLIDAMTALHHATGGPAFTQLKPMDRYHRQVFMTPPWPEIYVTDPGWRHDLQEAVAEYDRLLEAYRRLGYEAIILPKVGVAERADFVLKTLG